MRRLTRVKNFHPCLLFRAPPAPPPWVRDVSWVPRRPSSFLRCVVSTPSTDTYSLPTNNHLLSHWTPLPDTHTPYPSSHTRHSSLRTTPHIYVGTFQSHTHRRTLLKCPVPPFLILMLESLQFNLSQVRSHCVRVQNAWIMILLRVSSDSLLTRRLERKGPAERARVDI